jgi:hypothetical protein
MRGNVAGADGYLSNNTLGNHVAVAGKKKTIISPITCRPMNAAMPR